MSADEERVGGWGEAKLDAIGSGGDAKDGLFPDNELAGAVRIGFEARRFGFGGGLAGNEID
jgi:hypothetical protein